MSWLAAPLAGALWILCFPKPDLGWLAWFALAPLFWHLYRTDRSPLLSGADAFLAGFVFYAGLMHWIFTTCRTAGVSAPLAVGAWLGLAAVMAVHWALFGVGIGAYRRIFGHVPAGAWAALWVGVEWLSARWTTRFPWGLAGYTQWSNHALLPSAGVLGVYGLSFLVIAVNATIAELAATGRKAVLSVVVTAAMAGGFLLLGRKMGPQGPMPPADTPVAVLQGNVDQYKKWDEAYEAEILRTYTELADEARTAALVVWPESALPGWLENDRILAWIAKLAEATDTFHLIGAVSRQGTQAHNSAALFGPQGQVLGMYHKRQLVPFGEYMPVPFLKGKVPALNALGEFDPGPREVTPIRTFWSDLAIGICYEAIFPHLSKNRSTEGARMLVNLTNDGWYLDTAGPYQHFAMAVLRAAENRAYLLRAANTGISALVDPWGRIVARTAMNERTVLRVDVSQQLALMAPSFFVTYGEIFPAVCLAGCLLMLPLGMLEKKTLTAPPPSPTAASDAENA